MPFSELKIDRSYVMNCDSDTVNAGMCETIVELGKRFGLKIVAEGIETMHESHKLQGIGVNVGQGYLYAKPMPKGQLIGLMRKRLVGQGHAAACPRPCSLRRPVGTVTCERAARAEASLPQRAVSPAPGNAVAGPYRLPLPHP